MVQNVNDVHEANILIDKLAKDKGNTDIRMIDVLGKLKVVWKVKLSSVPFTHC